MLFGQSLDNELFLFDENFLVDAAVVFDNDCGWNVYGVVDIVAVINKKKRKINDMVYSRDYREYNNLIIMNLNYLYCLNQRFNI